MSDTVLVLGARGLVGSALVKQLRLQGVRPLTPTRDEVDLANPVTTAWYFSVYRPTHVFFAAAKVGGIADNERHKVDFLATNLQIQLNVLQAAARYDVRKLLFVGTSCMYPRDCPQPMRPEYLGRGLLEATTEAYSVAKIAGMKLCQYYYEQEDRNFVTALPCNVYGPGDNFHPETAHCLPGMLRRMWEAKRAEADHFAVWGDGSARREFIFADDLAKRLILVMDRYNSPVPINVGSGEERTMRELAEEIKKVVEFEGELQFDTSKPTGTPRKLLDNTELQKLNPPPLLSLRKGIEGTFLYLRGAY